MTARVGRWDLYFEKRAPGAWKALAAGIGLIVVSVRMAWGVTFQETPPTVPGLLQHLLPSMIGGIAVGLMSWGVMRFRVADHHRRLQRLEEHKVEKELLSAELRAITVRLDDSSQVQKDVIMDLIDRLDRRAQDVGRG